MPALSFKKQFAPLVESGEKRQTIRKIGKTNGWLAGARLYLYTGMRTKQCRKLGEATIAAVKRLTINGDRVYLDGDELRGDRLDEFVIADGFQSPSHFRGFFEREYGTDQFAGCVIYWEGFREGERT